MGQTNTISRILIADENLLFRRGIQSLISNEHAFQIVGEAATCDGILDSVRTLRPDVLVLNGSYLVQPNRIQFGLELRQAHAGLRMLVLAQQDVPTLIEAALTAGARGFMLKRDASANIIPALRNIAFFDGGMNASGIIPDLQALAAQTPSTTSILTSREQEVMRILAEGKTVRVAAAELSLSMKTIEAHKLNLMRKLDIHDRTSLIAYAATHRMIAATAASR